MFATNYVKKYSSPFPQNQKYFLDVATRDGMDGTDTRAKGIRPFDYNQCKAMGKYLKVTELPEIITWEIIDNAVSVLGKPLRQADALVRSSLVELGHLLAERGLIEDFDTYRQRRLIRHTLECSPERFSQYVADFHKWTLEGMTNPATKLRIPDASKLRILSSNPSYTVATLKSVNVFLSWCGRHDIYSLASIDHLVISDYQQTLFWQLECIGCHRRIPFDPRGRVDRCKNAECEAVGSYEKIKRLARASVVLYTCHIRTFFNWAQLHGLVTTNPTLNKFNKVRAKTSGVFAVNGEVTMVNRGTIKRYDDANVQELCRYIVIPNALPDRAI